MYNFKDEELPDLGKEFDLIFKVVRHIDGSSEPVLVGGKRYTC